MARKDQAISVNQDLTLRVCFGDSRNSVGFVKLDRVEANDLIDALSEYVGRKVMSAGRTKTTWIPGDVDVETDADRARSTQRQLASAQKASQ